MNFEKLLPALTLVVTCLAALSVVSPVPLLTSSVAFVLVLTALSGIGWITTTVIRALRSP